MAEMVEVPTNPNYIQNALVMEILQKHMENFDWHGEQVVLDADCGTGEITQTILFPLLPKDATLIGFEKSRELFDYCNKYKTEQRLSFKNVDVRHIDLFLSWECNYFTKIFSFNSSLWMQSLRRSLYNMHAIMKNDSDILLIFLTPDNPMNRAFENVKRRALWERLFSNRTWFYQTNDPVNFIRKLLNEIGFNHVYCYLKETSTVFPSWEAYLELIDAVNPYLPGLPRHHIKDCMMSIRDFIKYDNKIRQDPETGEITVRYSVVVAVAKKKEEKEEKKN
ncbi:juvenile hormone acid O-methyltransferase [Halyomorpha halys]|uniref:juvenile hormone acid O-methyltransferase n=1 Tax=Halyomorpha halys TaxID=286706 RepID=UPI0006D51577|nr:uncharacterized protein LOC106691703 [Halyomorpha halys]